MVYKVHIIAGLTFICMLFYACGDKHDPLENLRINDSKYVISEVCYDNIDTDDELGYNRIAFTFKAAQSSPYGYLTFVIYVADSTNQVFGTYEYAFKPTAGCVSHLSFGTGLQYDEHGVRMTGKEIGELIAEFSGTVNISKQGKKHLFEFDLEALNEKVSYSISGAYNQELQSGYVKY